MQRSGIRIVLHCCIIVGFWWSILVLPGFAQESADVVKVAGLRKPVEILTDRWGVPHIYAKNQHDLFFAQGYNAARERLFQLEIWRRRVTRTIAELQGPKALDRDIGARLLHPRLDLTKEMNFYHPAGRRSLRHSSKASMRMSHTPRNIPRSCPLSSAC